jgi:hypothetical protein
MEENERFTKIVYSKDESGNECYTYQLRDDINITQEDMITRLGWFEERSIKNKKNIIKELSKRDKIVELHSICEYPFGGDFYDHIEKWTFLGVSDKYIYGYDNKGELQKARISDQVSIKIKMDVEED